MKPVLTRVVAFVAVLAIGSGGWAECAGWQATPEARMACCAANGGCPAHHTEPTGTTSVTQAAADSCCAAGERDDASPAAPQVTGAVVLAVLPQPILLALRLDADDTSWRISVPIPIRSVRTHLLFSVLLV